MNNATRSGFTSTLLVLLLAGNCPLMFAQEPVLARLQHQVINYQHQTLQEKLFVHTDRSFYMTGETMWFRLFYVDGSFHRPLDISKVAYLELLDKDQKAVLQTKIPLDAGKGMGSLAIPVSLLSGKYVVRVYTHWMKMVSPNFLFEKAVTIVNPFRKLELPMAIDSLAYDVQLFPEGGNLVTGLPARVAFKVVDPQSGWGVDCQGVLLTQTNDTIARFQSLKFGMGTFSFTPAKTKVYHILLIDKKGRTLSRTLPTIDESGYTMQVDDLNAGQLKLTVRTNKPDAAVYLVGHTRQSVNVAEMQPVTDNQATFLIAKKSLGDGISHLTVFDAAGRPVCERLYFKRPPPGLSIQIKPDKDQYTTRAPVLLNLATTSAGGKPIAADMSVAVYRLDSLQSGESVTLPDYIWLTSDLRGTIESPEYYLTHTGPEADRAIDHLMLTHGWRRFRWEAVLHPKPVDREPIPEHGGIAIQGRVINTRTGLPAEDISTFLSVPGKIVQLYSSRSNKQGLVRFEVPGLSGASDIVLQTAKPDSTYRVEIINPYTESAAMTRLPVFDLAERQKDPLAIRSLSMQVQNYYHPDVAQVQSRGVDSTAFYGVADERYELDAFTRFTVMEEVLREYVPGVTVRRRNKQFGLRVTNSPYREVFSEDALILLDGIPIFNTDQLMALSPLKIKTLEVVTHRYLLGYASLPGIISFKTYKGDLGGFQLDPRAVLVEYDGLQARREFYAPRYETPQQLAGRLPDFRNLLYWNPQLTANAQNGNRATFYTADQEGRYLIVVQGMTVDGQFGSAQQQIVVRPVLK